MEYNKWAIDPSHSEIQFKIKHLVISTVSGSFSSFGGDIEASENFEEINATFEADVNSISTTNEMRDNHLKSAEFFDIEKYPKITFKSTKLKASDPNSFELFGNLTIKNVTKEINLSVNFDGIAKDLYGNTKAGFEITGKINRNDFGLTWSAITEAGGAVVSNEVKIVANIQLVKQG